MPNYHDIIEVIYSVTGSGASVIARHHMMALKMIIYYLSAGPMHKWVLITVTSHVSHSASNQRHIDRLLNSLFRFRIAPKNKSEVFMTGPLWPVYFPYQGSAMHKSWFLLGTGSYCNCRYPSTQQGYAICKVTTKQMGIKLVFQFFSAINDSEWVLLVKWHLYLWQAKMPIVSLEGKMWNFKGTS